MSIYQKETLLLTPVQAAKALASSPRKLWGMKDSGEIPHIRIGKCVRYSIDELEQWIDQKQDGGSK